MYIVKSVFQALYNFRCNKCARGLDRNKQNSAVSAIDRYKVN